MKTLDDLLVDVGRALDDLSAAHEPAVRPAPPVWRSRWVSLAAASLVVATGAAAVVALARGDEAPDSIKTTEPVSSAQPTVSLPPTQSTDGPPTTGDTVASPTTTVEDAPIGPVPGTSMPLEEVGPAGAPVVPAVLPDGYRAVMADHAEGAATGMVVSVPGGWLAMYIDRTADHSTQVPSIAVQITSLDGAPVYDSFPWAPGSPDVPIGRFVGRVANGEPDSVTAVIPLEGDRRLVISGTYTSLAAIETLASGLEIRADGTGADATVLPDGFELIDEGPVSGPTGSAEWRVAYAKDERQDTMFMVTATVDAARPAELQLVTPMGAEVLIAGRTAYRRPDGYVFDVGSLQVSVTWWAGTGLDGPQPPSDVLEAVMASLVAIPPEDFEQIRADVLAHPLTPIDLDCGVYVQLHDPASGEPTIALGPSATAPGSISLLATSRQPVLDVEFAVTGADAQGMAIETAPLLRLPSLGTAAQTITVAWDGTIGGVPAPPGTYNIGVRANADTAAGATCRSPAEPVTTDPPGTPGILRPGLFPSAVTFVVP